MCDNLQGISILTYHRESQLKSELLFTVYIIVPSCYILTHSVGSHFPTAAQFNNILSTIPLCFSELASGRKAAADFDLLRELDGGSIDKTLLVSFNSIDYMTS
jgi:hypothetical protein